MLSAGMLNDTGSDADNTGPWIASALSDWSTTSDGGAGGTDVVGALLADVVGALLAEVVGFTAAVLDDLEDETLCDDVAFGLAKVLAGAEVTADDGAAEAALGEEPATLDAGDTDSGGLSDPAALAAGCGGPGLLLHAPTTIRMTPISAIAAMAHRSSAGRPRLPDDALGT